MILTSKIEIIFMMLFLFQFESFRSHDYAAHNHHSELINDVEKLFFCSNIINRNIGNMCIPVKKFFLSTVNLKCEEKMFPIIFDVTFIEMNFSTYTDEVKAYLSQAYVQT
jgi:DNA primase catalytic subunit